MTFFASCGSSTGGDPVDGINVGEHRVFVTSTTTTGAFGGISGADSICLSRAQSSGLKKNYKAILSDSTNDAKDRLSLLGAVYKFNSESEKEKIVQLGVDLWESSLLSAIDRDEQFNTVSGLVWTGTESEGRSGFSTDCNDWSSSSSADAATVGDTTMTDDRYIEVGIDESCDRSLRIYCISQ
ncbi:MAG: DUF1554 domain-containing protein [Bacteriovoracaceae bacterium]|nr:DUF1554 domain-containing protein [Bacteriovoracaceae bacterium]